MGHLDKRDTYLEKLYAIVRVRLPFIELEKQLDEFGDGESFYDINIKVGDSQQIFMITVRVHGPTVECNLSEIHYSDFRTIKRMMINDSFPEQDLQTHVDVLLEQPVLRAFHKMWRDFTAKVKESEERCKGLEEKIMKVNKVIPESLQSDIPEKVCENLFNHFECKPFSTEYEEAEKRFKALI